MKYENTFKAIDQILWKEQGCGSELDYLEQKSWLLFLKYLDVLEIEREEEAELDGKNYKRLVSGEYRWNQWATPRKKDPLTGKMVLDTVHAMSGDDLVEFVDKKLFPYLKDFQNTASQTDSLEYKRCTGTSVRVSIAMCLVINALSTESKLCRQCRQNCKRNMGRKDLRAGVSVE